jgi:protein ImuB
MFAALWLPNFRLQAALRWREVSGAAALVDGEASKGVVLEVNVAAAESWVQPGLTPAQALARCPELRVVPRAPGQEAACQALLVELALGFSPRVEATSDGVCTLDLAGVAKGVCWQRLAEEMVAHCAAEGFEARVGIAPHADHAWLAACRAEPVNVVYDGAPFCAALPMVVLEPSADLQGILEGWGIRTVGEFLKLPAEGLIERLGPEAAALRKRVSGRTKRVLRLVRPAERFVEAFDFDYAIETTEPLLFLLKRFTDALSARLRTGYRVASSLTLTLPVENGSDYARTFSIPSPTAEPEVWFRILSTHLEALTLTQQPVGVRLSVEAADAAGRQLNLFESALRDPNKFGETLAQLKALVGDKGVGIPQPADTHRPGAFRMEEFAEAEGEPPIGRRKGLPLRRDRSMKRIAVKLAQERPAWVDAFGPVTRSSGPYRLSGEWWEMRAWWVEEWDVELADGAMLRIANRREGRWTVEGTYEVC